MSSKKINTKRGEGQGGGSITAKPRGYKPLIASSLALALGVSVASADTPIITYQKKWNNQYDNFFNWNPSFWMELEYGKWAKPL